MRRRATRPIEQPARSAQLTPVELLILALDGVSPEDLERLGEEAERECDSTIDASSLWRMDGPPPSRKGVETATADDSILHCAWLAPTTGDDMGRPIPRHQARVFGYAMASHGLSHGDLVRLDHDATPMDGDIVLAEIQGVGRVLRKLSIIGGAHVLSAGPGVAPIVVEDLSTVSYFGIVATKQAGRR